MTSKELAHFHFILAILIKDNVITKEEASEKYEQLKKEFPTFLNYCRQCHEKLNNNN